MCICVSPVFGWCMRGHKGEEKEEVEMMAEPKKKKTNESPVSQWSDY